MGWLRKFLGLEENSPPQLDDGFPGENRHQDRHFADEDHPSHSNTFEPPSQWRGSMMIDPFVELEKMIQDSFMGFGGLFRGPSLEERDFNAPPPSKSTSPRDQLLKQPDSEIIPDSHHGSLPSAELEAHEHNHPLEPFNPHIHQGDTLFSIMDRLMESFGRIESFHGSPHIHEDTFPTEQPAMSPRDAMIKTDSDLDEQTESSGIDRLLSEHSPSYSYGRENSSQQSPSWGPNGHTGDHSLVPRDDQHVHRSFTSTSIRRIVRPDGSIEERRTYRDSSGKEEVTVTEVDPSTAGSLLARDDFFGPGEGSGFIGSIFKRFF